MVRNRKIAYIFSGSLVLMSFLALLIWGLLPGIDFTGGSLMEVEYKESRPETQILQKSTEGLNLGNISFQPTGNKGLIVRLKELNEEEHRILLNTLSVGNSGAMEEKRFDSIGPVIGKELQRK